jgi:hypothetical protein
MNDLELYARYFPVGLKVGVGIPLPDAHVFKDWAIIHSIDEDLISLQLSRDILPRAVTLQYGQILELRGGNETSGYCCRAIVVSEGYERELLLRLIGEIVSDELREFYRIDAFLPIKYFVSQEQNLGRLRTQWKERCAQRQEREQEQKNQRWVPLVHPEGTELPCERLEEQTEKALASEEGDLELRENREGQPADSWDTIIPLAANISGGGLRIITHQGFEDGEYMLLEIFVPSPQRVVDVVGRVVFANRNYAAGRDQEYYNTGVQFVCLDERDRDAIIHYISNIQLIRIKQLRERYLYRGVLSDGLHTRMTEPMSARKKSILFLTGISFIVLIGYLVNYFRHYATEHPKGEIQRIFEEGIKKYRDELVR